MTNEQAIEVLNCVDAYGVADEAKKLAIKALEKQIPNKPIIIKYDIGAEIITCGKCHMCTHITRATDYCPHCGTKIDWAEGENE